MKKQKKPEESIESKLLAWEMLLAINDNNPKEFCRLLKEEKTCTDTEKKHVLSEMTRAIRDLANKENNKKV